MTKICECGHSINLHGELDTDELECYKCSCKKFKALKPITTEDMHWSDRKPKNHSQGLKSLTKPSRGVRREGDFNLSEKIVYMKGFSTGNLIIPEHFIYLEDVKTFIKRLKAEMRIIDEQLHMGNVPKLGIYQHLINEIDKLAGVSLRK